MCLVTSIGKCLGRVCRIREGLVSAWEHSQLEGGWDVKALLWSGIVAHFGIRASAHSVIRVCRSQSGGGQRSFSAPVRCLCLLPSLANCCF